MPLIWATQTVQAGEQAVSSPRAPNGANAKRPAAAAAQMPSAPEAPPALPRVAAALAPGAPALLDADAAVVVDADSGRVLYALNPDSRMYPASLTKMMTCALAVEAGNLERMVTVSQTAAQTGETGLNLEAGEQLKLVDLVRGALIWSANDAAEMVGEAVGGSRERFVALMNRKAAEWGARGTHFANPHGLHEGDHFSTARDLALIAAHAMKLPQFSQIVATREIRMWRPVYVKVTPEDAADSKSEAVAEVKKGGKARKYELRVFTNRNRLLPRWDLCDGVKTGYTKLAGRCLAASATCNGWRAIAVILHAKDPWTDGRALLEWAFRSFERRQALVAGQGGWSAPVCDGVVAAVSLVTAGPVQILVPRGAPPPEVRAEVTPARAPVVAGQKLGVVRVMVGREVRARTPLLATGAVELSLWGQVKQFTLPGPWRQGLLGLAAGVLLLGTAAKAARARRPGVPAGGGAAHPGGTSDRGRPGRDRAGRPGRPRPQRDRP